MTQKRLTRFPVYLNGMQLWATIELLQAILEGTDDLALWDYAEMLDNAGRETLRQVLSKLQFLQRVSELPPKGGPK